MVNRHNSGRLRKRLKEDREVEVTYTYVPEDYMVIRKEEGRRKDFGAKRTPGRITQFEPKAFEKLPGFYRVDVAFEVPTRKSRRRPPSPEGSSKKPVYPFRILVNKRSSTDTDREIKWNYAYPE